MLYPLRRSRTDDYVSPLEGCRRQDLSSELALLCVNIDMLEQLGRSHKDDFIIYQLLREVVDKTCFMVGTLT